MNPTSDKTALDEALESAVLLRNEGGLLPLKLATVNMKRKTMAPRTNNMLGRGSQHQEKLAMGERLYTLNRYFSTVGNQR